MNNTVYLPLSSVQREIWFNQMFYPNFPLYNIGGYALVNISLDLSLLERAMDLVVEKNDVLRIILHKNAELPVQEIIPKIHPLIKHYDFSKEYDPHTCIKKKIQEELLKPFILYGNTLYQFMVFRASKKSYYLVQKYHHIIVDGWAISLIAKQIVEIYNTYIRGNSYQEFNFSYVDYINNDQAYSTSDKFQQDKKYWLDKYRYIPSPLFARKIIEKDSINQDYNELRALEITTSIRTTLYINRKWYNQLNQLATTHQSSIFHLILGALYCYFIKVTQREDLCIGIALLNRNSAAFKQTVGLFTSVIPVWFKFGTELTFLELMSAIHRELRQDYRHQRFPVSEINRAVGLHKQKRIQLFDIMLSLLKEQYDILMDDVPIAPIELSNGFKQNPLEIFIDQFYQQEEVSIHFDYNLAFFDEQEIEQLKMQFAFLLQEILNYPDLPLWKLEIMPLVEKNRILYEFNETTIDYPLNKTIIDLFEEQVVKTPEDIAVIFKYEEITYHELNKRANQLAHYLQILGVDPEKLVGICLERSTEMIVGLLGILKAGGAYVPLDPTYPQDRLIFMLEDAKVFALVTEEKLKTLFESIHLTILCLDERNEVISQQNQNNLPRRSLSHNLAYVIYTSGSTGKPKGVQITHYSLSNFLHSMSSILGIVSEDIILSLTTISFDIATLEIYLPLTVGAKVVLISRETAHDREDLIRAINYYKVTVIQATPATWHLIITDNKWQPDSNPKLLCGGEALSNELAQQLLQKSENVWNVYGPTETTVWSTIYKLNSNLLEKNSLSYKPIGHPIANTQIYILDHYLRPVSIGTIGELYIGGAGLARGYLNRPELTAEKFILHPFSDKPDERIYKTGDLARYLPDGTIEYLGRIDTQVKIRGFRIELGEIEATLKQYTQIHDAVVIVKENNDENKQLVAYYIAEQEFSPNELRDSLKKHLPHYMIPSIFMRVEGFPLTPNGKVNRRTLPEPDKTKHVEEKNFVAPRNHTEKKVAEIWSQVLGVEHIGIHDNFFELGGHSLSATRILFAIQTTFSIEIPLHYLFEEATTIATLSQHIEIRRWAQFSTTKEQISSSQKHDRIVGKL